MTSISPVSSTSTKKGDSLRSTTAHGWWYLSFADEHFFKGGCYVLARDIEDAVRAASEWGCDADGSDVSVIGYPVEDAGDVPPWRMRNRLLTRAELDTWRPTKPVRPS